MEIWKWIEGYEGLYQISNYGRVKSFKKDKINGIILKPKLDSKKKYLQISLCNNGVTKYPLIHRLVALAFIPNDDDKPQVNHKDGNHKNNHVDNLEWVTAQENIQHAYDNKLINKEVPVYIVDVFSGKVVELCKSITLASKITNSSAETIRDIMSERCGTATSYIYINGDTDNLEEEIDRKLKKTYVIQMIDKNTDEVVEEFLSHLDAKKKLGITSNAIHNCLQGISKTALGYKWRYKYR